jgi:flagellar basal-body rod modification protein FlgD
MIDEILATQTSFYGSEPSTASSSLDKDAFLQLLVTQLQNQDPLNPMDDKEFIAQLAQFSSLEQMSNVSEGIDSLVEKTAQQDMLSAVNYIGKEVTASGSSMTVSGSYVSPVYFTLDGTAANVFANIYDANNNLVRTEKFTSMQAGEFEFTWDGTDYNGDTCDNGQYEVYFSAESASGDTVFVDTEVTGTVIALQQGEDEVSFTLNDGRTISFSDITKVVQTATATEE